MIAGTTYDLYTTHCFGPSEETYKPVLESNYTDMTINDKASVSRISIAPCWNYRLSPNS